MKGSPIAQHAIQFSIHLLSISPIPGPVLGTGISAWNETQPWASGSSEGWKAGGRSGTSAGTGAMQSLYGGVIGTGPGLLACGRGGSNSLLGLRGVGSRCRGSAPQTARSSANFPRTEDAFLDLSRVEVKLLPAP